MLPADGERVRDPIEHLSHIFGSDGIAQQRGRLCNSSKPSILGHQFMCNIGNHGQGNDKISVVSH